MSKDVKERNPLKIASRAYVNFGGSGETYDAFREEDQRDADEAMRAALLALAECVLPDETIRLALKLSGSEFPRGRVVNLYKGYEIEFRAMLRSIANEGKTDV